MADLNTEIKIGADASGVEAGVSRAKRSLADLGNSAKKVGQDAAAGVASIGEGSEKAAKKVERDTRNMQGNLERYLASLKAGSKDSRAYWENLANLRGVDSNALRPLLDQIEAAKSKTQAAQAATNSWSRSLAGLGVAVAGAFSLGAVAGFGRQIIDVQRQFDALNSSLITVTGSSAAAAKEMEWLRRFASTTPYQLNEVTQAFVKMKALGLDAGEDSLRSYGNTAAAMGKSLNQMIEAVADASTGEFERLKEFGIKARKDGDEVALTFKGVTTTIKNSSDEITAYLKRLGEVDFASAMEEHAKTLDGAISNLADSWDGLLLKISQSGLGNGAASGVRALSDELGVLSDVLDRGKESGGGFWESVINVSGTAVRRAGFNLLETNVQMVGEALKGVIPSLGNFLSTVDLMPNSLKPTSEQMKIMVADLGAAKTKYDELEKRLQRAPDNIYIKSELGQLAQYIAKLEEATKKQRQMTSALAANDGLDFRAETARLARQNIKATPPAATGGKPARTGGSGARTPARDEFADLYGRITAKDAGIDPGFYKDLNTLYEGYQKGRVSVDQYRAAVESLVSAQRFAQDLNKSAAQALETEAKFQEIIAADKLKQEAQVSKGIASAQQMIEQIQFETSLLGLNTQERERAVQMREFERLGLEKGSEAFAKYAEQMQSALFDRQQKQEMAEFWSDFDSTAKSVFLDIAENGEDAFERIGDSIKREVLEVMYELAKKWVINVALGSSGGGNDTAGILSQAASAYFGSQGGDGGGGGGGGSGILGLAMQAYKAYTTYAATATTVTTASQAAAASAALSAELAATEAAAAASASSAAAASSTAAGTGAAAGSGAAASGGLSSLGAPGWGAIIVAAIVAGNNLYKAGYDRNALTSGAIPQNRFGQYSSTSGQGVGQSSVYDSSFERYKRSMLEAIGVNEQWSDILSGTTRMAALFGRKLAGFGFDVDVSGANVGVTGYESYKGGLFRSDKTRERAVDPRDAQMVRELVQETRTAALETARNMGLSTEAIEAWNGELKINFKNVKDAEDAQARYNKALGKMYEDMIREAQKATFDADMQRQVEGVRDSARTMAAALGLSTAEIDAYVGSLGISMDQMDGSKQAAELLAKATEDLYFQMLQGTTGFDMTREKFDEFIEGIVASAEAVGISAKGISDILVQGMTGRLSQAEVGDQLASMIVGGIYNAIAANYANTIAQAFTTQIITPIFTAIAAGVPISQAISKAAIANVVKTAQNAAAALKLIFDNAEFQAAIKEMGNGFKGVAAAVTSTAGSVRGLGSAAKTASTEAKRAREQIQQEWKSIADSIIDEVKRIRGEVAQESGQGYAFYAARFAIATGQARAGNQGAAQALPELSQSLLDAARMSVTTLAELQLIEARTAQSLQSTAALLSRQYGFSLPSFDVGTDYVPQDMVAMVHKGERITPAAFNPVNSPESGLADAVRRLSAEVQQLKSVMADVEGNTADTSRLLKEVTFGEQSLRTVSA